MKKSFGAKNLAPAAPVWAIGTYDTHGKPNVMTASWVGICCSQPPCLAVSLRKATYTYGALMVRRAFTVSVPGANYACEADYFGMVSGRNVDKFAAVGLTPEKAEFVDAPYVAEFPWVLECQVIHTLEIGLHTLFVGEIKDVKIEEAVLNEAGLPDVAQVDPLVYLPEIRDYHALGALVGKGFDIGKDFL